MTDPNNFVEIDDVVARTQALWPKAASMAGLPEAGASFRRLQIRSTKQHCRSAVKVSTPNGKNYVLRAEFDEYDSARFLQNLERHKAAAEALKSETGVSVPAILWQDLENPYLLMEFAAGDTAFRELVLTEYGFGDRQAVVQRIGKAVAALHRVSEIGEKQFWPKPYLDRVSEQAQALRAKHLRIPKPNRFLGLCAYLQRAGRDARGHRYTAAIEHGDLHLRNILVSDATVSFIDFSNSKGALPQRDLANIWLANCPDHLAKEGQEPGYGLVAKADWDAFEEGYGAGITGDPVFRFFFALRLFKIWLLFTGKSHLLDKKDTKIIEALVQVYLSLVADEPG